MDKEEEEEDQVPFQSIVEGGKKGRASVNFAAKLEEAAEILAEAGSDSDDDDDEEEAGAVREEDMLEVPRRLSVCVDVKVQLAKEDLARSQERLERAQAEVAEALAERASAYAAFAKVSPEAVPAPAWAPAEDKEEEPEPVAPENRTRILFLPLPMRGHVVPLMRLAEQFTRMPQFEIHCSVNSQLLACCPKTATIHCQQDYGAPDTLGETFDILYRNLSSRVDWVDSQAGMIAGFAELGDEIADLRKVLIETVKKVDPQIVVADHGLSADGRLPQFCLSHREGLRYVALNCTGRPENIFKMISGIATGHLTEAVGAVPGLLHLNSRMAKEVGPAAGFFTNWITLLPSCKSIVGSKPNANDVFLGPFLPLPTEDVLLAKATGKAKAPEPSKDSGPKANAIGQAETMKGGDLLAWLEDPKQKEPVVYVAFGTIVMIDKDVLSRLAFGLQRGRWRVLWAMKDTQQKDLPPALQTGGKYANPDRWRLEHFAPQPKILAHERTKCFFTHCGQNSITECLAVGTPMVCLPFFCDQYEWADSICVHRKAGVLLSKTEVTQASVRKAVGQVLQDESYKNNAVQCALELQRLRKSVQAEIDSKRVLPNPCVGVPLGAALIAGTMTREEVEALQPTSQQSGEGGNSSLPESCVLQ